MGLVLSASMAAPLLAHSLCFKGVRAACVAAVAPVPAHPEGVGSIRRDTDGFKLTYNNKTQHANEAVGFLGVVSSSD